MTNMLPENYKTLTLNEKRTCLVECLQNDCEIVFIKIDGSLREMPCTLRADVLPNITNESTKPRKFNPETLSVWCLDKKEWRSFKLENVVSVKSITVATPKSVDTEE